MIPEWFLAGLYLAVAVVLVATARSDFGWVKPPRLFLTLVMASWAGFYVAVMAGVDFSVLRSLSRWLHLPTALAVMLIALSRWYHDRRWADRE